MKFELNMQEVKEKIKADVIVKKDAKGNAASTIINTTNNYQILRQGPITEKEIFHKDINIKTLVLSGRRGRADCSS